MTNFCYCIFESCNGAQEVEGPSPVTNGGMDFGSGSTANVSPVQTPPSSNIQRLQEPEKGESYESNIYNRHSAGIGDLGYDPEQLGPWLQSTAEFG
jgi:hypothetical protein